MCDFAADAEAAEQLLVTRLRTAGDLSVLYTRYV